MTLHPDDVAVNIFAETMKTKLKLARLKGRSGWETATPEDLQRMLHAHIAKGDPVDVANFCMFLSGLGARVAPEVPKAHKNWSRTVDVPSMRLVDKEIFREIQKDALRYQHLMNPETEDITVIFGKRPDGHGLTYLPCEEARKLLDLSMKKRK